MLTPLLPMTTARLILRPFTADDFDAAYQLQSRPEIVRFLLRDLRDADEAKSGLLKWSTQTGWKDEGDALQLAVQRQDTAEVIGEIMLVWSSVPNRTAELGFAFLPEHHGQGFAKEASLAMLRWAFEGAELHRVIGRCDARNTASAGLMRRLGMRLEAQFLRNEFLKGEWCDEQVFAMLAQEWPNVSR